MTVENISWSISTKECCRPRRGLNPRPPGLQSDGASNWATEADIGWGKAWAWEAQDDMEAADREGLQSGSSRLSTLMIEICGDLVWDLPCMQQVSYLEGGLLCLWMLPLYLHVNQKSDYDDIYYTVTHYSPQQMVHQSTLTLVLLKLDIPCLCKQCRSRSVGFWRSQLIWICTVCHSVCEFIATIQIKESDWLTIRSGHGMTWVNK